MAKTFFGKILEAIGSIFKHVLAGAKKTFDNLSEEQKAALKHGSGVIALINTQIGKTPAEIKAAILSAFPDLDVAALEVGLYQVAHSFNLAPQQNNLEDTIAKIQAYLSGLTGPVWEGITQSVAGIFAIVLAPAGTKFAAVGQLLEYVYLTFFKNKKW